MLPFRSEAASHCRELMYHNATINLWLCESCEKGIITPSMKTLYYIYNIYSINKAFKIYFN